MESARILIVEDDEDLAAEMQELLADVGYEEMSHARTGQEALREAQRMEPDVILMDIGLRDQMDGVDTACQLRDKVTCPLVYVTGRADEQTLARAGATRPAGYLVKPFTTRELSIVVQMALSRRKAEIAERQVARGRQQDQRLQAAGLVHDFNNLLTVIGSNVSYAARKVAPYNMQVGATLDEVLSACERASKLTRGLASVVGFASPVHEIVALGELVQEIAEFALRGSTSHCVSDTVENVWPVAIDEGLLSQVVTNLVLNAHEAGPSDGAVHVCCTNRYDTEIAGSCESSRFVEVAVTDRGAGIDPAIAERIFDPYFSTKKRGSGLGLATTRSLLSRIGGRLTMQSEVGAGSVFRILLPAMQASACLARHFEHTSV